MQILRRVVDSIRTWGSQTLAIAGFLVSLASLYVAYDGARSSNAVATQALATATQANEIALGRIREPAFLQFSESDDRRFKFDFTSAFNLEKELHLYVSFKNDGKKSVEGAVLEVIGIEPLTYPLDNPSISVQNLPSTVLSVTFNSAVQPEGSVHFDIRKLVLQYLSKLADRLPDRSSTYNTVVNVVVTAKGLGEAVAVGAPSRNSPRDRVLLTIRFKPDILDSAVAKKILADPYIPNRVYSP